ncbi:hypothetical protein A0H81_01101 [Grifola frondosa]|uniref:Uncharacterized protein n=1 Tax=Grifola frondosa TaxID=5627 RepID=A0A1C7MPZ8_GRIFR|nr:hypothetical protein A0H81_01101 [Grifola frondosa]
MSLESNETSTVMIDGQALPETVFDVVSNARAEDEDAVSSSISSQCSTPSGPRSFDECDAINTVEMASKALDDIIPRAVPDATMDGSSGSLLTPFARQIWRPKGGGNGPSSLPTGSRTKPNPPPKPQQPQPQNGNGTPSAGR